MENGKTRKNGKKSYAGSIRGYTALMCAQGALGRHLCARYTIQGAPFPDPEKQEAWFSEALWAADRTPTVNISYTQLLDNIKAAFVDNDIISRKITHAFRVYMAQRMDEAGVDDQVWGDAVHCLLTFYLQMHRMIHRRLDSCTSKTQLHQLSQRERLLAP